jgi:Tol biopolymer transport system component/DNA-binding winged helix-turn-helix (wHTH) protein
MKASAAQVASVIRFGVFELDARSGELRKSGVLLSLQDQPLKVLECLLERPGELVTREALRQRLWPGDTFVDFEQGVNAAIKRLRETLADSAESPRFVETLPRRGYRFIAPVERDDRDRPGFIPSAPDQRASLAGEQAPSAVVEKPPGVARRWRRALGAVGAIALVLMTIAAWLRRASPETPAAPLRVVALTTLTGSEYGPTFSPDGSQVAFAWDGEQQDNSDIYVKLVGSSDVRRLTTHAAVDSAPQWSPDGKWIAYARSESPTSSQIRLMSSLGGSDRALSHFPLRAPATWSPDGRYVVAGRASEAGAADQSNGIYLIPVEIGEPRLITRAVAPANDAWPAFSTDGRHLAYASCQDVTNRSNCHIQVLDLDSAFAPLGSPRRVTPAPFWTIQGLAWTRDGTFIVFAARQGSLVNLWRVGADGTHEPVRIEVAGMDAAFPATTASADRLAFSKSIDDEDIFRLDVGGIARPVARSSVKDTNAQFSPDGQHMAFCSARSGDAFEVWVAGTDGSKPERLTRGPGRWQCSPTWSPDGKRIAFDSQAEDGSWHVWTIDVEGGAPQQITKEVGDQMRPTWSRDGQWIYFIWGRGREHDIWRTRGPNRPHERVTHSGSATRAWESADGIGVFYKQSHSDSPLYFQPLSSGAPRAVIPCVAYSWFSVVARGVHYVPCQPYGSINRDMPVRVRNPVTGEDRQFATLEMLFPASGLAVGSFAVSPDGQTILYSRLVSNGADLMLIENFR